MPQSPRFELRRKEIAAVINKSRLKETWKNKVRSALRNQFLPDPLDFYDFQLNINHVCDQLENLVLSGNYIPKPARRISQEKSKGLCRLLTIPQPTDLLILQCLSNALYADIKKAQTYPNAFFEPEDHSMSAKDVLFSTPNYGSYKSWLDFQKTILKFAKERDWVVVTDIANYYDFIDYVHLRNVIAGTIDVRESILDFLIFTLSSMLWQPDYTPRFEVGLPQINADAPRILAHCFLFELDSVVASTKGLDYARFMDDIDVGADTLLAAKKILKRIDLVLQTRQIRLNSGKTKIMPKNEARSHFKIRENAFLDQLVARLNSKFEEGKSLDREREFILYALNHGFKARVFETGNGEKILKRIITIATRIRAPIPTPRFSEIIRNWPNVRENIMQHYISMPHDRDRFSALVSYIAEEHYVDDISWINFAKCIVASATPKNDYVYEELGELFLTKKYTDFFELYAKIWILSKFGNADELLETIKINVDLWSPDETLGRLVGGLFPIFKQDNQIDAFDKLVTNSNNKSALDLAKFHRQLTNDTAIYLRVQSYLKHINPSLPTKIAHAKFLMLLSALNGYALSEDEREGLIKIHHSAFVDGFYAHRLGNLLVN